MKSEMIKTALGIALALSMSSSFAGWVLLGTDFAGNAVSANLPAKSTTVDGKQYRNIQLKTVFVRPVLINQYGVLPVGSYITFYDQFDCNLHTYRVLRSDLYNQRETNISETSIPGVWSHVSPNTAAQQFETSACH